jgi:hypothetical protein
VANHSVVSLRVLFGLSSAICGSSAPRLRVHERSDPPRQNTRRYSFGAFEVDALALLKRVADVGIAQVDAATELPGGTLGRAELAVVVADQVAVESERDAGRHAQGFLKCRVAAPHRSRRCSRRSENSIRS